MPPAHLLKVMGRTHRTTGGTRILGPTLRTDLKMQFKGIALHIEPLGNQRPRRRQPKAKGKYLFSLHGNPPRSSAQLQLCSKTQFHTKQRRAPFSGKFSMKPKASPQANPQRHPFMPELVNILDPNHALVRLSKEMNWRYFDNHSGEMFDSEKGRPATSTRLIVALHYLKFSYDLSDEAVLADWLENPYWQFFSGMKYFTHEMPIDSSSMTVWRRRFGQDGADALLKQTIEVGLKVNAIKESELKRVNVDTTVQEKFIRYPTDIRLYDRARERLVKMAKKAGIELRQNYNKVSKSGANRQTTETGICRPRLS
jgi:hypothetical protein